MDEISQPDLQHSTKFSLRSHIWYHQWTQLLDQDAELAKVIPLSIDSVMCHIFHYFQKCHLPSRHQKRKYYFLWMPKLIHFFYWAYFLVLSMCQWPDHTF